MISGLFDGAVTQLSNALTYATRRQEVLARNVANLETPGYRARDLVLDSSLRPVLSAAPADLEPAPPAVGPAERRPVLTYADDGTPNATGNDVRLDRQMARIAENTLFHHALVQLLTSQFTAMKQAISGRV